MAEFALLAPVFFVLMFGLIELGRAVYYTQILDSAARDGTRYAIVHGFQSFCPSGPLPSGTNICDPAGDHVLDVVLDRSIGVTNKAASLATHVKWCDATSYQAGVSQCFDTLPCSQWADPTYDSSPSGLGDGDNNRNQIATVCVVYTYDAILGFLPIPDFTVTGRATLVVNN